MSFWNANVQIKHSDVKIIQFIATNSNLQPQSISILVCHMYQFGYILNSEGD